MIELTYGYTCPNCKEQHTDTVIVLSASIATKVEQELLKLPEVHWVSYEIPFQKGTALVTLFPEYFQDPPLFVG